MEDKHPSQKPIGRKKVFDRSWLAALRVWAKENPTANQAAQARRFGCSPRTISSAWAEIKRLDRELPGWSA